MDLKHLDNEVNRIKKLHSYNILDTTDEQSFDEITKLAALLCETTSAAISLVDSNRQWFKSRVGIEPCETPRDVSFCTHAILNPRELLVVPDATKDERFSNYPFVTVENGLRFYAGAPLVTKDDFVLGTLCVLDSKVKILREEVLDGLRMLANRVVELIEIREKNKELEVLAKVVETSENLVIITNEKDEIEYVNPAFERITGYVFDEVEGKCPPKFLRGEMSDNSSDQLIKDSVIQKKSVTLEFFNYSKSGDPIIVKSNVIPLFDDNGKLINHLSVQTDITESKKREQELLDAKEQALESVKLKQQFLSNMSHEIRTPMNGIIGLTNLLLDEEDLKADQYENLKHIQSSASGLLRLINDILDFSKANAGKLSFQKEDFNLKHVFSSLHKTMGVIAKEKGIDFTVNLDSELPTSVFGDPHRLRQILLNLAGNAVKFTEFGRVEINVKLLKKNKRGSMIKVFVKDTGEGIPEEKLGIIFDEFEQVRSYTKDKANGTGLGLSIVKKLVEMYKGSIEVESIPGEGSTFSFTAQLGNSKDKSSLVKQNLEVFKRVEPTNVKILLVEDNIVNQLVARKHLEKGGYEVLIANNGKEGLEYFQKHEIDLIIMDVQMPVMNGLEATKIIRSINPNIPIVGMTASVMEKDLELCYNAGMNSHIPKPFESHQLYETLQSQIRTDVAILS